MVYTYNGLLLSHIKNESLPFATIWMHIEHIVLSKINQRDKLFYHLSVESEKYNE